MGIIALIFQSPDGYHRIREAIRNRFFHAVLESGQRLPEPSWVVLSEIFAPATVYYAVLSGISREFYEAERLAPRLFAIHPFSPASSFLK
jgi:hypothetical protein